MSAGATHQRDRLDRPGAAAEAVQGRHHALQVRRRRVVGDGADREPGPELPAVDEEPEPLHDVRHPAADRLQAVDVAVELGPHRLVALELQRGPPVKATSGRCHVATSVRRALASLTESPRVTLPKPRDREVHPAELGTGQLVVAQVRPRRVRRPGASGGRRAAGGSSSAGVRARAVDGRTTRDRPPASSRGATIAANRRMPAFCQPRAPARRGRCPANVAPTSPPGSPSAADGGHRARRAAGSDVSSMPCPAPLADHRGAPAVGDLGVVGAARAGPPAGRSPRGRTGSCAPGRRRSAGPGRSRRRTAGSPRRSRRRCAGPPSTVNSSAGALPRGSSAGSSVNSARSDAKISSAVTIASRLQPCWASSGICSMNRSW